MNAWTKPNVTYKTLYERLIYINSLGCVQNKHKKGVYLNSGFDIAGIYTNYHVSTIKIWNFRETK